MQQYPRVSKKVLQVDFERFVFDFRIYLTIS